MARKKRRGPGRPKGSKNKPKQSLVTLAAGTVQAIQRRLIDMPSAGDVKHLAAVVQSLSRESESLSRQSVGFAQRINGRVERLEVEVRKIADDAEHPTTQILARRLLTIEQSERLSLDAHDRLEQLESDMATLRRHHDRLLRFETDMVEMRRDMKTMLADYFERTNRDEVAQIANQPTPFDEE